jgi:lipopolysaccharide/colanic/teichoic acid biosynthesis glycosyltransferase
MPSLARLVKRAFDVIAAFLGLLALSPLFGVLALLIKKESPGPVFYRGVRVGREGKEFLILKFRTMHERPESYSGPRVTVSSDPRVTKTGRWLRSTKLNELPQLWNVLKGDMSVVGPRPEDPEIVASWPAPIRQEVLSIRPGITSPASVIYRDEEKLLQPASLMDDYLNDVLPRKLRLDQLYVRSANLLSDTDVVLLTLIALLPRLRPANWQAEMLFNGPVFRLAHRYLSWFVIDIFVAFAAVAAAAVLWRLGAPLDLGWGRAALVATGLAITFSLFNSILGLDKVWWEYARPSAALDLAFSSGLCSIVLAIANAAFPGGPPLPPGMVLVGGLLAWLGFVAVRYRRRLWRNLLARWTTFRQGGRRFGERVLIIGAGECGQLAAWLVARSSLASAFSIVGMVDDDLTKQGMTLDGYEVLGQTRRIPEIVKGYDVGVILFAIEKIGTADQARIVEACEAAGARLVLIPDLLEIFRRRMAPGAGLGGGRTSPSRH